MIKKIVSTFIGLIMALSISLTTYANGSSPNGKPFLAIQSEFLTLDERVSALEVICQSPFSLVEQLEAHEGVSQIVCGSEELYTAPSISYRQLISETVIAPVCLTQSTLQTGLKDTLKKYLEDALNVAADESATWTSGAINDSQAAIVGALNAVLAAHANNTNNALSSTTSGINIQLGDIESSLNQVDVQINLVNNRVGQGVGILKNKVRDFIKTLDDPDFMPDFIDEGAVNNFFSFSTIPANLNITDVNLGSITFTPLPTLFIEAEDISITVGYIHVDIPDLLEQALDAVNLCNYPEQYTDLLLTIFGFEEAIDVVGNNIGIPVQVPTREDAVKMCSVRGGHICTESELDVLGVTPNAGDWAGGSDSSVVWLPGTKLYSTAWPPIQPDAGALFNFPRKVPFNVSTPVYPTGNFRCCTSTIQ